MPLFSNGMVFGLVILGAFFSGVCHLTFGYAVTHRPTAKKEFSKKDAILAVLAYFSVAGLFANIASYLLLGPAISLWLLIVPAFSALLVYDLYERLRSLPDIR